MEAWGTKVLVGGGEDEACSWSLGAGLWRYTLSLPHVMAAQRIRTVEVNCPAPKASSVSLSRICGDRLEFGSQDSHVVPISLLYETSLARNLWMCWGHRPDHAQTKKCCS